MIKKSFFISIVVLSVLILSVSVFAAKPITLTFGDVYAPSNPYAKIDEYFAHLVDILSDGELKIDYYPAQQLGSEREMFEATISGAQDITQTSTGTLATLYPPLGTLELPYIFSDQESYYKINDEIFIKYRDKIVKNTSLRVLFWRERAPRHLTTNFPVNSLDDIQGLSIRVSEVPIRMAYWEALGTNPTPIPWSEVYTSLATGVIDAEENPLDTIYSAKLYEQQKYVTLTGHMHEVIVILINNDKWESLSSEHQRILTEAGYRSSMYSSMLINKNIEEYRQKLIEKGMIINTINKEPFIKVAKQLWGKYGDKEVLKLIQSIK